jgi:hypothetical protein
MLGGAPEAHEVYRPTGKCWLRGSLEYFSVIAKRHSMQQNECADATTDDQLDFLPSIPQQWRAFQ